MSNDPPKAPETELMICEIINPSDPYTLECSDFLIAAVAVAVLGRGQWGLDGPDDQSTPVLFGWDDWFAKQGVDDLNEYLTANSLAVAAVLDSVRIGSTSTRRAERIAVEYMTPQDAKKYRDRIHDDQRTSMNNIGAAAWSLAERMRGAVAVPADVEGTSTK